MARSIRRGYSVPAWSIPRKKRSTLGAGSRAGVRRVLRAGARAPRSRPSQPRYIDHQLRARVRRTARLDGRIALARVSSQHARRGPAAGQRHSQSPRGADTGRIHGVHHVFHPPVALSEWPDADRRSRIVFITRGIARKRFSRYGRQAARQLKTVAASKTNLTSTGQNVSLAATVLSCRAACLP